MKTAVYLDFKHNARDVIEAYKNVFNAEVVMEIPYEDGMTQDRELLGKIFHAELKIGDLNLYLSDSGKEPGFPSMKFVVEIPDGDKALRCFEKLVENGKKISDFEKMPYGPRIARAQDTFGVRWDIVIC